ncbi:hypothetical protein SAMN04489724_2668 [Algoriphagus locisalis]|uniref:Uncharacterized protein n=1 Tax=Algoriphagus locisalis TaxID=305507 RepID=A0A1I7BT11_9BACT|nr:hypothetical protein [Algoriphagus locisalis]SFT90201.1 hypothetical protein SAMN04489724_2668 [Algoriphagus locisalis]
MKLYLFSITAILLFNFNLLAQETDSTSEFKEPVTIKLICRQRDISSVPLLLKYRNKCLFMPSDLDAAKREELLSSINPAMIDSINVKRNEEALTYNDLQVESGLIVVYLNTTFKNSASQEVLSEFKLPKK